MKNRQKLFYKVFLQKADHMCSTSTTIYSKLGIDYDIYEHDKTSDGYITAPGNTRFFLFETLEQARNFIRRESANARAWNYRIKAVQVKGGYATNCKGIQGYRTMAGGAYVADVHSRETLRTQFWNNIEALTAKKISMSKACELALDSMRDPMVKCVNTPYYSVFARHIKILPDIIE